MPGWIHASGFNKMKNCNFTDSKKNIMRKKIVAGNWKMNLSAEEAMALANELKQKIDHQLDTGGPRQNGALPRILLFPPYVYLSGLIEVFRNYEGLSIGVQNIYQEEKGAYTGEVSPLMVRSMGGTHTLIGHSERRMHFNEDDELLAKKTALALKNGLIPVYCCGEMLPERETGKHFQVVAEQLKKGVFWMKEEEAGNIIIAYEPVWAIGTGQTASPDQAQEMHAYIRQLIADQYSNKMADRMTILYGGSCNAKNAAELFAKEDVDGGLIGGASLKADDFFRIIQSF